MMFGFTFSFSSHPTINETVAIILKQSTSGNECCMCALVVSSCHITSYESDRLVDEQ